MTTTNNNGTNFIYVVIERILTDNLTTVELFQKEKDARQYIDKIIAEYGLDNDQIISDGNNWYDLDLKFFDILLTEKQINPTQQ